MSGKGRGHFLFTQNLEPSNTSTSSGETSSKGKDSGLGSSSATGEYRRVGRGRLIDDLSSSCSSLCIGRGRAKIFESIASVQEPKVQTSTSSAPSNIIAGRGRSQAFSELFTSGDNKKEVTLPAAIEPENGANQKKPEFYKPAVCSGSKGNPIRLACNYIQLCSDPMKGVYVYEVRFNPNVDSIALRGKYLNEHKEKLGGTKTFDGVTLYLPVLLKDKLTTFLSKNVIDSSEIEIRVLFKRKESLKNCIHLYNVLFDRVMKTLNYVRFDRKQFDPTSPKIIPHSRLEVWPGYVTSVDECEGGLLLCCDVSHRLLCQQTVLDTLVEIYHCNSSQFQENVKKNLLGSVIITRYNNRTYRIDDICFDKNPLSTFETKNGQISYVDYYRTNHNIHIKDLKQPLLLSIKKLRGTDDNKSEELAFCLIPEVCHLTGLRDEMRSDYKLMREIASFTRVSPNQRLLALEKFYNNINSSPEASGILSSWGLSLKEPFKHITGRQMEEEQIYFAKKTFPAGPKADFGRYAGNNELLEVVHLRNWILIHCRKDVKAAKTFFEHIDRNSKFLGVQVQRPQLIELQDDRTVTYVEALRSNIKAETQIVVCICPTSRDDRYAAIKKVCCAEIPVPSQVINARTLSDDTKNKSIVQKIALQMNCKLGGSLWAVKIPFKNVMVCGMDSFHDAAQKGNSVAAFVASLNSTYTKWYSKAVIQTKKEELVNGLCSSFIASMAAYEKENGRLPDNVILFRDGVGDGQLPMCTNFEVPQLEAACQKTFPNYSLKITFIVVQKRINTRLFALKNDSAENPLPGTIVDVEITRVPLYDFYLVSQSVRQGTVTPTHFIVLRDDAGYTPDIIQRLSYKLCFLYYNWPGTIRIPACCQYAHKMAYLIGQSIKRATSEELAQKLFYL